MNILGPIIQFYHSELSKSGDRTKLIIIHDELELKPLVVQIKRPLHSSKHKGPHGLGSVFASLRAYSPQNLFHIGIGIGPVVSNPSKDPGKRWVLSPLTRPEVRVCSWDVKDSPSLNPQHRRSVVLEAWKQILEIIRD
ncbi:uncharacterized protein PGTG_19787 [Puccinia graminis f. sp. tritici CRL 75-36-700-3]|uniref:Uncharacterized protein n=1 Tax=Puccinia graminis f. sp. tritici (strain CRL 75-36-700-3 / race SCCL) TaxID=418459 RepID=E3LB35_PUCGT|nr:uncharacterized protein PGTG_19787 [Puccinia graminis f. sp. tritici CRL 75-36-700-3]EFP93760.2 hypothetical protein PGTG_19787 [Puccinia graminis f. sp. tritici CRL 75-36-700-3]